MCWPDPNNKISKQPIPRSCCEDYMIYHIIVKGFEAQTLKSTPWVQILASAAPNLYDFAKLFPFCMCNPRICQMVTRALTSQCQCEDQTNRGYKELREVPGTGVLVYEAWVHAFLSLSPENSPKDLVSI